MVDLCRCLCPSRGQGTLGDRRSWLLILEMFLLKSCLPSLLFSSPVTVWLWGSRPGTAVFFSLFQCFIFCSVCSAVRRFLHSVCCWTFTSTRLALFSVSAPVLSAWKHECFLLEVLIFVKLFFLRNSLLSPRCFWFLSFSLEAVLGCLRILPRALG